MTAPRIAYVINSLEGGGAALPVPAVASVLRDTGADVCIFALERRDGRALTPILRAGLPVVVRDGGKGDHHAALRWLDGQIAAWHPSHIWTSLTRATLLGQLVGRRHHLPVVSWQHNAFLKPVNRLLLRMRRNYSNMWVADSQSVAALTEDRLGIPHSRLMTWPLFFADPDAPQASPWSPGQPIRVGSLGRLHPAKGYDVLVAALARMKADGFKSPAPVEFIVGGEGRQRDAILALARQAGVGNLQLAGFVNDPRDFLAGLHLYVQPSRAEGLCIAAHEAMQAGLAVIVSAVGEMPYSVTPGITGEIVTPGDPDTLARALVALLTNPAHLATMGDLSRESVLARFGKATFVHNGQTIMDRLVAGI
jgi:glycosyltransferase involved in cell wall biosynthesis